MENIMPWTPCRECGAEYRSAKAFEDHQALHNEALDGYCAALAYDFAHDWTYFAAGELGGVDYNSRQCETCQKWERC